MKFSLTEQKFIDDVLDTLLNTPEVVDLENFYESYNTVASLNELLEEFEVDVMDGATKCVIVPRKYNFVIKIPYRGDSDGDFFSANSDVCDDIDSSDLSCWDYCQNEIIKYHQAIEYGCDEFFPEIELYEREGYNFYIQKKCVSICDCFFPVTKESRSMATSLSQQSLPLDFCAKMIEYYGLEKIKKFIIFISELTTIDSDLHRGNLGFMNDRPIILDWGGYRE